MAWMMYNPSAAFLDPERNLPANNFSSLRDSRPIEIRLVSDPAELAEIYEFRYQVYVEEMRFKQHHADHCLRRIEDPLDVGGYNFAAFYRDELVGVVRVNFPSTSEIGHYEDLFDMASAGRFHPDATSISTRLMTASRFRGTNLALRLCRASYAFGLDHDIRFNFLNCADRLVPFFERLGYAVHRRAEDPEHGLSPVMRLDLLDRARLTPIRSPFLSILNAKKQADCAGPYPPATRQVPTYTA